MNIPELETSRLIFRAHSLEDFDACKSLWSDANVIRYISGVPSSEEETWARFLRYRGHWQMLGFGYWVLVEKASGEFIGEVGFANYKRDLQPALNDRPEAGWVLKSSAQGKGYGQEAVNGMLAWVDQFLDVSSTVCIIDREHKASIKLALSCGYIAAGTAQYKDGSIGVYERARKL